MCAGAASDHRSAHIPAVRMAPSFRRNPRLYEDVSNRSTDIKGANTYWPERLPNATTTLPQPECLPAQADRAS
jgi:hypothetical protein